MTLPSWPSILPNLRGMVSDGGTDALYRSPIVTQMDDGPSRSRRRGLFNSTTLHVSIDLTFDTLPVFLDFVRKTLGDGARRFTAPVLLPNGQIGTRICKIEETASLKYLGGINPRVSFPLTVWCWDALGRYDFRTGVYSGPALTCVRASTGLALDSAGAWRSFGPNALRRTDRGLLIEPGATNLCSQSASLDAAAWSKQRVSVVANVLADPLGGSAADKIVEDASSSTTHYIFLTATINAGQRITGSCHLKAGERGYARVALARVGAPSETVYAYVSLLDGSTANLSMLNGASQGAFRVDALAGGWYRVSVTGILGASPSASLIVYSSVGLGASDISYTGDGASGLYAWGAQIEAGDQATSYVPTTTAAAARAADQVSVTIPAVASKVIYTFDDGSTFAVPVSSGLYTVPTILPRPVIATMDIV